MSFKKIATILIVFVGGTIMSFSDGFPILDSVSVGPSEANEKYRPIVVLELFTSQGCSSCPPADALLNKVKNEHGNSVFALSYHVDYWNYIGWADPFSNANHSKRQRDYNIKLKNNSNYTPELIVNGKEHFVGSDASKVNGAIRKYSQRNTENELEIRNVRSVNGSISFDYTVLGDLYDKNLRAVLVLDERTTQVKRGENRNRSLTNSSVVVSVKSITIDKNSGSSYISIPEIVGPTEKISLIVLTENFERDITAATKTSIGR